MALPLYREARWLFVGDSITDCGRGACGENLGNGYVRLIRDWLLVEHPSLAPEVLNRGISGNRVVDLADRWEKDVLALSPQLLSIKIGINDVWQSLNPSGVGLAVAEYRTTYRSLLTRFKEKFPDSTLVLNEPSVIWPPHPENGNDLLQPYIAVVRELGAEFKAPVVLLHDAFLKAKAARPDIDWIPDGLHPESAGHMLIARKWLTTVL